MTFEWHEPKRVWTLTRRGLDFADADLLFEGPHIIDEARTVGGEERWLIVAVLRGLLVAPVFTRRGTATRTISMRRARDGERRRYQELFR